PKMPNLQATSEETRARCHVLRRIDRPTESNSDVSACVASGLMRASRVLVLRGESREKHCRSRFGAPRMACAKHGARLAETLALRRQITALARMVREPDDSRNRIGPPCRMARTVD